MKINKDLTNKENILTFFNNELERLKTENQITSSLVVALDDIDISSPESTEEPGYNTKIIISNKPNKNKLSRPVNFIYNRVDINEYLKNEVFGSETYVVEIEDDSWETTKANIEETVRTLLRTYVREEVLELVHSENTADNYTVMLSCPDNVDNLLYVGDADITVKREGTI